MQHSNATMATSSFDRTAGLVQAAATSTQRYNNFRVQTLGGNIIQGQVNKIRVAEVMFPYGIPTVIRDGSNPVATNSNVLLNFTSITLSAGGTVRTDSTLGGPLNINVPTGFYTGNELATVIQNAINTKQAAAGIPAGTFTVAYDAGSGSIVWQNTSVWSGTDGSANYFMDFGISTTGVFAANFSQANLLWTVGLRDIFAATPPLAPTGWANPLPNSTFSIVLVPYNYPNAAGVSVPPLPVFPPGYGVNGMNGSTYTGCYTQYIDICSPTLCQAQYVRDGNTNQQVIRRDLICRLYVANEVSLFQTDPTGTRPFVIHRQFKNAKVMKWTAERSIDAIDIQLFDQFGQPLPVIPGYIDSVANPNSVRGALVAQGQPSDFAITFLVDEHDETREHNVGYTA